MRIEVYECLFEEFEIKVILRFLGIFVSLDVVFLVQDWNPVS